MNLPARLPNISHAKLPELYENAKTTLAQCEQVDECKQWADKAAALASYAKQAEDDTLEKHCMRIRARAIRRAGELLKDIESARGGDRGGGRPSSNGNQRSGTVPLVSRESAARDAGMSERQTKTAVRVANVPKEEFERDVESESPPTVTALAERGKRPAPPPPPPPKPVVDMKGRDPRDFKAATEASGALERFYELTQHIDPGSVARGCMGPQKKTIRLHAEALSAWVTRLLKEIDR